MDRLSLTVVSSSSAGAVSYSYTSGTNQLASLTDTAGTRSISYDGRGNTSSETRPGSITVATSYDGYGRLTDYDRSNIDDLDFAYNGLDDRVEMALGSDVRAFLYDADGRIMGEYGNSVSDVKAEFIWLNPMVAASGLFGGDDGIGGYAPLAVATPDSLGAIQVNWVHGNHLGVPLVTTDSGGSAATTPDDYFAPGFPGQSRVLADLYYNRYRDYDPTTGRYIQTDPIGLDGGNNIYLYAEANPVNLVDPTGEYAWIAAGLIGFGVGAAIEYFDNPCATAGDLLAAGAVGGLSSVGWGAAAGVGRGVALAGGRGIGWAGSKIAGKLSGRIGGLGGKGANGIKPKVGSAGGDGAGKGFPNKIKAQARSESSGTCVFCGTRTTNQSGPSRSEIDHAFPKSRGGNNTLNNAQNTCRTCNRSKGAKTTDEFLNK